MLLAVCVAAPMAWPLVSSEAALARMPASARGRLACVGQNSAKVPCHFSTPSGNVRCVWTPHPNNVACVVVATGRAFRLRPTGRAKSIHLHLQRRGETLPTDQQLLFPNSLSCHDTRTTMTCSQDFGLGEFTLPVRARTAH